MKRIKTLELDVNDATLYCQDIVDVKVFPEPEMVEVTIKCVVTKDDYNKMMEEIGHERIGNARRNV